MSVYCMARVFNKSKATGIDRFVLLSIADNAWDDGSNAWPSIKRICYKTGLGRRTVQRAINSLIQMGELERIERPGHSSFYNVLITDEWPDNPFLEDDVQSTVAVVAKKAKPVKKEVVKTREPDLIWEAVLDVCGINPNTLNQQERGKHNRAMKLIRESQATPDDVYIRAQVYRKKFDGIALTPLALANHWSSLDPNYADTTTQQVPKGWDAIKEARERRGA